MEEWKVNSNALQYAENLFIVWYVNSVVLIKICQILTLNSLRLCRYFYDYAILLLVALR